MSGRRSTGARLVREAPAWVSTCDPNPRASGGAPIMLHAVVFALDDVETMAFVAVVIFVACVSCPSLVFLASSE